jgi:Zinc dependent phospholipase C
VTVLCLALILVVLAMPAWGPGHHLEFAQRVWRRRREHLPRSRALLLGRNQAAYNYGNLAADVINMKAYGGHRNHCHRWTIIERMRELAEGEAQEAFILGYLSHLAADTIAHNHFVPYHLVRYARGRGLGHLYWEMMADRHIPEARWAVVAQLKGLPELAALDALINASVPRKALSMGTNKLLFNHVLLVSKRRSWRRGMDKLHPIKKVRLERGFLGRFQRAAVARMRLALTDKGLRALAHVDTTGKAAQKQAARTRRKLVHGLRSGPRRDARALELALPFLEGMESPPPGHRRASPHW